jgi:putative AdoMet-dependent methyltransferase
MAEQSWTYDGLAGMYDQVVQGNHPLYARYNDVLDLVAEKACGVAHARVLDIGAGTGNLAVRCIERGACFVGLDPSAEMLSTAQRKLASRQNVQLLRIDRPFLSIPFPDQSFDAVVSTYAYHHVPPADKPASLVEMVRVLKAGGSWVLGDLMFEDRQAEAAALERHRWLEREHFAHVDELRQSLVAMRIELQACQFTPVTWVVWGVKPA